MSDEATRAWEEAAGNDGMSSVSGPPACEAHNMRVCEQREADPRARLAAAIADAAALREQLAEYERDRDEETVALRGALATAEALSLTNGEARDSTVRALRMARAELASARAVIVHSSFAVGASAARAWLAAHPALTEFDGAPAAIPEEKK